MTVRIERSTASGRVTAPPSKSIAHRALICAALSTGSTVKGISGSKDMEATLAVLRGLGAEIEKTGDTVTLGGLSPENIGECTVSCNESGSTLRFFIPICLLSDKETVLTGTKKLMSRPLDEYERICRENGLFFEKGEDFVKVRGPLKSGHYKLSLSKSSQFMTGLLFALSCLEGDSVIELEGKAESLSYVDLTLLAMTDFGMDISVDDNKYYIKGSKKYKSREYTVEGDCSNAAFLEGLNFLGSEVRVEGISGNTVQGDRVYPELFEKIKNREEICLEDCPDLAPVLFALAAYFGEGHFTGTKRLSLKESDRVGSMKEELKKFGAELYAEENRVDVSSDGLHTPNGKLCGHNDHRIVMALSLLCTVFGGEIEGAEAVSKSYPDFFKDISSLGIEVKGYDA